MSKRRPRLTSKAVDGIMTVQYIAESSLESFASDGVRDLEYERSISRGIKYIRELAAWYHTKQDEVSDG